MSEKNKNIKISDSKDEYDTQDSVSDFDLPLDKLNIGPRKKLLVMNNGILYIRVHCRNTQQIPRFREPDLTYGPFSGMHITLI